MINLSLNKRVLLFGFIFTFFSSFGQSFFLGLFNPSIRNELNITHGQFGTRGAAKRETHEGAIQSYPH